MHTSFINLVIVFLRLAQVPNSSGAHYNMRCAKMSLDEWVGGPTAVRYIPPGKLLCYITGKLRKETPEEHVRQRVARSLVEEYGYAKQQIELDFRIRMGRRPYPVDIAIFRENRPHRPENIYIIIETKKEGTKPEREDQGIGQLYSYMQAAMNCEFGMWTNGVDKICYEKKRANGEFQIAEILDIPPRGKSLEDYEKLDFSQLRPASELKSVFRRCVDYIYGNQGLRKDQAFSELLKLIFCKVQDEKTSRIRFYVTNSEIGSSLGSMKVKERLDNLFETVKHTYPHIFADQLEKIVLQPRVLSYIVSQLQYYWLLRTDTDVKGDAYEELVGENLRGNLGEFFTPREICKLAVDILFSTYKKEEWTKLKVLDPACGTGGFLISVINYIRNYFYEQEYRKFNKDEDLTQQSVDKLIMEYCGSNLYGIDFNELLVRASQMNEVMHGNGSSNLFAENSLLSTGEWTHPESQKINRESFNLVFTNPPFGATIRVDDRHILENYELGHLWENQGDKFVMTDELRPFVPPEQLFIERCVQFLKPNGRLAIVLPDSVLNNPSLKFIRYWILTRNKVLASVDLPRETFLPSVGTKTSVLFLEKLPLSEISLYHTTGTIPEYELFMAMVSKVGKDRRGVPIYKRSPEGEVILVEAERQVIDFVEGKKVRAAIRESVPIRDNELPEITSAFQEWWKERQN